ncbi:MAG: hypothetical protein JSS95_09295 [Acidobacteria bacterium]|nr:hypothetical protein [Acidobacteriota bacterium]
MNVFALLLINLVAWLGWAPGNVAGHYVLEDAHEMGSELVLKPDGRFEYMLAYGAADYTATGKWRVAGDTVVLDSKLPTAPAFKLLRSNDLRSPDVRVWVKGTNGSPVANLDVALTTASGEVNARTDRDGMALFPGASQPKSVVIRVAVYNKDSGPVALNPAHTDFTFVIDGDAIATVPFRGEALKIGAGTLEMLYWDKTRPMVYRKQR